MALVHRASSAWVVATTTVTPTLPTGTTAGDLMILFLFSKYDDAVLSAAPDGWTDLGAVANTGRSAGNDNGNLRGRAFVRTYQAGDTMPTLAPTPNNVSAAKISSYYSNTAGKSVGYVGELVKDDTVGTPLVLTTASAIALAAGDIIHNEFGINSDVATFGAASTITGTTGATLGTRVDNVADATSTSGTDIRMRSQRWPVSSGSSNAALSVSTTIGGTTTNTVGVGLILRLREVDTPRQGSATGTWSVSGSATGVRSSLGSATGTWSVSGSASGTAPTAPGSLPGSIAGVEPEAGGGLAGPWVDGNGNLYRVTEEQLGAGGAGFGNHPMMMKSSDGGSTWTRMDAANSPGYGVAGSYNDMESAWLAKDPANKAVLLAYMKAQSRWWGVTFRTSDHATNPDTWDTSTFATSSGQDGFATGASESAVSAVVLSNGTARAFVRGDPQGGFQAILHRTRTSGAWDTGSTYITESSASIVRPSAVVANSDITYLFYIDATNNQVRYRTISSAGVVGASARVDTNGVPAAIGTNYENNIVPPVFYMDGATPVVVVGWVNASNQLRTVEVRGGTPGSEQVVSTDTVTVNPTDADATSTDNQGPSAALAVVGTKVYALWGDNTTGDLYYAERPNGGSWSARTLLADTGAGKAVHWLHATSEGTNIHFTYDIGPHADDGGAIKYNKLTVAALGVGSASGSWSVTGSASGVIRRVSEWSASASATTQAGGALKQGSATGSWSVSGSAQGVRTSRGAATGTWAVAGSATGARTSRASATGTWSVSGVATGQRSSRGSAVGAWSSAGSSVGSRASEGSAGGAWAISGAANGARTSRGTSTGTWSVAGNASGSMPAVPGAGGSGSGTWTVSGNAQGVRISSGLSTGSWSVSGVATGQRASRASATGTWTVTGSAQGVKPGIPGAGGSSTGFYTVSGSASGQRISSGLANGTWSASGTATGTAPTVGTKQGAASGSWTVAGAATGATTKSGAASATWSVSGAASGTRPASGSAVGTWSVSGTAQSAGARAGSATGSWSVSGWADGIVAHRGAAVGGWTVGGDASGGSPEVPPSTGSASGLVEWSGAATGERISLGNAIGTWTFSAVAVGITTRSGTAVPGGWVFTGTAHGLSSKIVPAARPIAYLGSTAGSARIAYTGGTAIITSP